MTGTVWAALAALTLLRLAVAAYTPLAPDEAYYWVWSRALAPGYLDHPPMVALWIRAGTWMAGQGPLGVRLLAPLAALLGTTALAQAAEDCFPNRKAGPAAAWLLNATLLFGVGAVTMTPDTPLLFFWTLALWAMGRLIRTGNSNWWLVVGVVCGLALSSKYTAIMLPAGIGLWVIVVPAARIVWQCWVGAALGIAGFLPPLIWNAGHDWASFAKQGGRGFVWNPAGALGHVGELVGGQIGLATPLVFLICAAGTMAATRRAWLTRAPADSLLTALIVPPVLVFLQHALGDRVQANWPAIVLPAAAVAAAGLAEPVWQRMRGPAIALGLALTALVYVQVVTGLLPLPARLDPTARVAGWGELAVGIEQARSTAGAVSVVSASYSDASLLARLLPSQVIGIAPRWALFTLQAALPGQPCLLVQSARRHEQPDPRNFLSVEPVGDLMRRRGSLGLELFHLYRVVLRPGGDSAVLLPLLADQSTWNTR